MLFERILEQLKQNLPLFENKNDFYYIAKGVDLAKAAKAIKDMIEKTPNPEAIALIHELGKAIDDKEDISLWAYRNQARIRTVCITN
jgi:endonuclease V-like protein UPF0215 family